MKMSSNWLDLFKEIAINFEYGLLTTSEYPENLSEDPLV